MGLLDHRIKKNLFSENKKRLFVDCTHTLFFGETAGIQRVVKNIITVAPKVAPQTIEIVPIIWTGSKFITKRKIKFKPYVLLKWLKKIKKQINPLLDRLPNIIRSHLRTLAKLIISLITGLVYLLKKTINPRAGDIIFFPDATWNLDSPILRRTLRKYQQEGIRVGFLFHDIIPMCYPRYCLLEFRLQFTKWFQKTLQYANFFIAVSETVRKEIVTYAKVNNFTAPVNNFNHSGVSFGQFQLHTTGSRYKQIDKLTETFANPSYIFVSTIEPRKNHNYAIDAFEILWGEKNFPGQLIIIGRIGWLCDKILRRIKRHSEYNERLFMFNDASDSDLLYAYEHAKGSIFTSFTEGFGLPIIESLYFGLPVFASDIPVHREINKDLIYYCDLTNPRSLAEQIYQEYRRGHQQYLNRKPKINLEEFSWEKSCRDLIQKILVLTT